MYGFGLFKVAKVSKFSKAPHGMRKLIKSGMWQEKKCF